MGLEVKEDRESESQLVMRRIGLEPIGPITPRESGQTSNWSLITREHIEPLKRKKQMSTQVGAHSRQSTGWQEINWPASCKTVERLQAGIVKATPRVAHCVKTMMECKVS